MATIQDDLRQLQASNPCVAAIPSLSEWLSREVDDLGLDARQPVLVAARWQCTRRLSDRMASMEFSLEPQVHRARHAQCQTSAIRLPVVDLDSSIQFADKCQAFWFSCTKQPSGWSIEILRKEPTGAIGELIQELRM